MPIIRGAASDVTTLTRVNSTQTTDPQKKSRTFVAPNKAVIAPIVNGSIATNQMVRNWKSPSFKGRIYIT